MKRLFSYILMVFCLVSCIKDGQNGADLGIGDVIPDFTVMMNDGTYVTGRQLREGVSCIVFFTTACSDCREVLPSVQSIYSEYLEKGVRFALISRSEEKDSIEEFWSQNGFIMPYSPQKNRNVYELFASSGVPRIYICRDGVIKTVFTDSRIPTYEEMSTGIDAVM